MYRYKMGPLILKVFEGEFGKDRMINVLRSLYHELETDGMLTLESFRKAALASGVSAEAYATFYDTYLSSPRFEQNVLDYFSEIAMEN